MEGGRGLWGGQGPESSEGHGTDVNDPESLSPGPLFTYSVPSANLTERRPGQGSGASHVPSAGSVKLCCPPGQKPAQHLSIWSQAKQSPLPRDTCRALHPRALGASVHDQPVWPWQHDLRFSASTLLLIALDLGRMDGGGGVCNPITLKQGIRLPGDDSIYPIKRQQSPGPGLSLKGVRESHKGQRCILQAVREGG